MLIAPGFYTFASSMLYDMTPELNPHPSQLSRRKAFQISSFTPPLLISGLAFGARCTSVCSLSTMGSLRIATRANLVRGYGLVFNRGQRVEGISDVGWTLLMVIPQLLHWRPELFAVAAGFVSACAAFLVAFRTAIRDFHVSRTTALIVICGAVCNADFWLVALNGIESGLYALVLTCGFTLIVRNRLLRAGFLLGLATTLRPESVVFVPITIVCFGAFSFWETRNLRTAWQAVWARRNLVLPWAVIVFSVLAWRLSYYGELLPNTVPAKAHPLHVSDFLNGSKYLFRFFGEAAPWTILPLVLVFLRMSLPVLIGFSWLAFQVAVVLGNGGDWMFGYRFGNVFFPLLVLLSACSLECLIQKTRFSRLPWAGVLALIVCFTQFNSTAWTWTKGLLYRRQLLDIMPDFYEPSVIQLATLLKPVLRPDDVVSPEVLGIFSYILLDTPMHDWLGLADAHIAHSGKVYFPMFGKADPAYSVDVVAPAIFAFDSGEPTLILFQKYTNGRFAERYGFWQIVGKPVTLALRRDREQDLLRTLRNSTFQLVPITIGSLGANK